MIVSLITSKQYITLHLPQRPEGRYILQGTDTQDDYFEVRGNGDIWSVNPIKNNFIQSGTRQLTDCALLDVVIGNNMEKAFLFAENTDNRYRKYARCLMPDNIEITVGTASDNMIVCKNPHIMAHHMKLICRNRKWVAQDLGGYVGTFVNYERINNFSSPLKPGDVVSILNQKFIILPGLLTFNAQNVVIDALSKSLKPLNVPQLSISKTFHPEVQKTYFHRQIRFINGIEDAEFDFTPPPDLPGATKQPSSLLSFGPAVTSGLGMLLGGLTNPITGLSMLAGTLLWPQLGRKQGQKLQKEEEEKRKAQYMAYLEKMDKDIENMLAKQTELLRKQSTQTSNEAESLLRDNQAMWNHREEQADFLDVRLGTGDIPAKANVNFPDESITEQKDPVWDKLHEMAARPQVLYNVPIQLKLGNFFNIGISGPKEVREPFAAQIISQLAMHIGYDNLHICIIGKLSKTLDPLRWLPHTWTLDQSVHMIAENKEELEQLMTNLDSELSQHLSNGNYLQPSTELVFFFTDEQLANSGIIHRSIFEREFNRVHVITLAEHSAHLPPHASSMIIGIRKEVGRMKWQDTNSPGILDFVPDPMNVEWLPKLVSMMANTYLDLDAESMNMVNTVPFLDMYGIQDVTNLNILDRWSRSDSTRSLKAPIGITEDGNLCMLDLHEKGDGPHGLIAGTTGSGKSELIMSYILSMSVSYSPLEVSFVLIDYKGGGMAQAFENLPHTVGIITNLDGNEINRSLMSIESEIKRRQRLFSETERRLGCKNLNIYDYQRYFREKRISEPLPHLIIISDEFAELKLQEPEFLQQLISAARIGRSLGVHLILATQKPGGVVDDQIWSNSNFHLCLRVQEPNDSQDVLKAPDAAYLTNVGSFYKQVGYGTSLIKAQSAWTGAPYTPNATSLPDCGIEVLDHCGSVLQYEPLPHAPSTSHSTQLDEITSYITQLAQRDHVKTRTLWQPPLEEHISLQNLRQRYDVTDAPWELEPVLGELDDPANQRRDIVRLPLSDGKNTIIYGSYGSGIDMLLTTILSDLMVHHTPEEVQIYILDYADDGLQILTSSPHVGDVLGSDDDEKFRRLLAMLENHISERKKILNSMTATGSLANRLKNAGLNHIFVVLHHINTIQLNQDSQLDNLTKLLSDGPRYGITFLATEEHGSGLRFQLQQRFARRYVLQMDMEDDYMMLLGKTNGLKPGSVRGRGIFRDDDVLYEFQTAKADQDIAMQCEELRQNWKGISAAPIRTLPDQITTECLIPFLKSDRPFNLPVGFDIKAIDPVYYPFDRRTLHLILGTPWDISAFLSGILPMVKDVAEMIVLDPSNIMQDIDFANCVGASTLSNTIEDLFADCKKMAPMLKDPEKLASLPNRFIVIPSLKKVTERLEDSTKESLEAMLEKARPEWKWIFIVCDTPPNMASATYSPWFKASASAWDGIYLGNGISSQTVFQINADMSQLYKPVQYPSGYVVHSGKPTLIQFADGRK